MKILGWILALPFIALALFAAARFVMCRPDGEVVRVATPMVEKIADYIVKHGVPESLADIPDLPYKLEGCRKKTIFKKNYKIVQEEEAEWKEIWINCKFKNQKYKFNLQLYLTQSINEKDTKGKIEVSFKHTKIAIAIDTDDAGKKYKSNFVGAKAVYHSGFCAPLKQ